MIFHASYTRAIYLQGIWCDSSVVVGQKFDHALPQILFALVFLSFLRPGMSDERTEKGVPQFFPRCLFNMLIPALQTDLHEALKKQERMREKRIKNILFVAG